MAPEAGLQQIASVGTHSCQERLVITGRECRALGRRRGAGCPNSGFKRLTISRTVWARYKVRTSSFFTPTLKVMAGNFETMKKGKIHIEFHDGNFNVGGSLEAVDRWKHLWRREWAWKSDWQKATFRSGVLGNDRLGNAIALSRVEPLAEQSAQTATCSNPFSRDTLCVCYLPVYPVDGFSTMQLVFFHPHLFSFSPSVCTYTWLRLVEPINISRHTQNQTGALWTEAHFELHLILPNSKVLHFESMECCG